jgi:Zn finger protein HypA/HybF involved in hydrogenase expression
MTLNTFIFCCSVAFNIFLMLNLSVSLYRFTKLEKVLNKLMHYECKNCFDYFISAHSDLYCDTCKEKKGE